MEFNGQCNYGNSYIGTYYNDDASYESFELDGLFEERDGGLDDYSIDRNVGLGLLQPFV
jgi:hypothetical protein